jgi:hypothetical protein
MGFTDNDVYAFIEFYRKDFGEELPFTEAKHMAGQLMLLMVMLTEKPDKKEGFGHPTSS